MSNVGAHPAPGSALLLDIGAKELDAELRMPLEELQIAFGQPLAAVPADVIPNVGPALERYVRAHLAFRTADMQNWTLQVVDMRVDTRALPDDLVVRLRMTPPPGADLRRFEITDDLISHQVPNHVTIVSVRTDWRNGVLETPHVVGTLRFMVTSLAVDLGAGSEWRGIAGVARMGTQHIADGPDHLLFLLMLLLPAPLIARHGRWAERAGTRQGVLRLVKVVTAFTIGHSITLAAASLGWLRPPEAPVECFIALSILVSALHAMRPIFPGREPWVAAGFGLVHGLAFASALAGFDLPPWHMALAILGFNVGIELMQIVVIVLVAPWLILLAKSPGYDALRWIGALFGATLASGWLAERALGWHTPATPMAVMLSLHPAWLVGSLALLAFCSWRRRRRPSNPENAS